MKFILRDDDINFHYSKEQLEKWYDGIVDRCPISICIPAFVKGDFFKWVNIFEKHIPYDEGEWLADNTIYRIGDNKELVQFISKLIANNKAAISMHGIHHRNEEMDIPPVPKNFIRGAEFYTNNNYTEQLKEAKEYLEGVFNVRINSFTPPQNMINVLGVEALKNNNLSVCVDWFVSLRSWRTMLSYYGVLGSIKLLYNRFVFNHNYPYVIENKIGFIGHCRLQPGNKYNDIINAFKYCYKRNGVFVLSTHSYGFDVQMTDKSGTMKDTLMIILDYVKQFPNVEFTTLNDLFN